MNSLYKGLGIKERDVIAEPAGGEEAQKYYLNKLSKVKEGSVLLQHNPSILSQSDLADLLT